MNTTNYKGKLHKETILNPIETEIRIEAWIQDAKYLTTPNRYGEYEFTFTPQVNHDYGRIKETVNTALRNVEMLSYNGSFSREVKDCTETRFGTFKCSQLFAPKLNKEVRDPMEAINKQVSLKLHLRDAVDGSIYLQCEYMDFYQEERVRTLQDDIDDGLVVFDENDIDF